MASVVALGVAHLPLDPRHRLGGNCLWSLGTERSEGVVPVQTAANYGRSFRFATHPDQQMDRARRQRP